MLTGIAVVAHTLVVAAIGIRIIMKRPAPDAALAWLFVVAALPVAGLLLYLLIGERRIDLRRARAITALQKDYRALFDAGPDGESAPVDWQRHGWAAEGLDRLGRNLAGSATVAGSAVTLHDDAGAILRAICRDIEAARNSVVLVFYIWNAGGTADEVLEALIRAVARGVACRVLVDAVGSRPWLHGRQPGKLRAAGVEVRSALPVGIRRSFVDRTDVRLHRKIAVIDGEIAWTGSMNLVDPRYFKQTVGVGEWVDAMVRIEGTAVAPLAATAIGDWMLESGEAIDDLVKDAGLHLIAPSGQTDIQVIPSGPGESGDALLQMLLALINGARRELIVTTPYLVPDPSVALALRGAAGRGVAVSIVVPERVDSVLTRHASRSYYDDLLDVGASIFLYRAGLLHTKSITVDGGLSMFGTVNLDMRSMWLNYEVTLFLFDAAFTAELRTLQMEYVAASDRVEREVWAKRPPARRFIENAARLIGPLL